MEDEKLIQEISENVEKQMDINDGTTGDFKEDQDMVLEEDDMEEVVFDENDDKEPIEDEGEGNDDYADDFDVHEVNLNNNDAQPPVAPGQEGEFDFPVEKDTAKSVFSGHTDSVYCVDINIAEELAISGGGDDVGYIWNLKTGETIHKLSPGHTDTVVDCGFNFDGTLCATAGYDAIVKVFDTKTGNLIRSLDGPSSEIEFMVWHQKGNVILAGSEDATGWIWDTVTGNCLSVLAGHEAGLTCGSFTPNGKRALTGSLDGSVRLWNPKTSQCVHTFSGFDWHQSGIVSLTTFVQNEGTTLIAAGAQDGTVRIANLEQKKVLSTFVHSGKNPSENRAGENDNADSDSVETISFCEVFPYMATGGTDGTVKIFDLNSQACRHVLSHKDTVVKVEFLPKSHLLISASADGTCRLWDSRNGECIKLLTGHENIILNFKIRGNSIVTCSDDKTCRMNFISS